MQLIKEMILDSSLAEGARVRKLLANEVAYLGLPQETVFDLQLAVSEAFNNAAEHGFGLVSTNKVAIRLYVSGKVLSIEVEDSGRGIDAGWSYNNPFFSFGNSERGMGLAIIRKLMDEVKIHSRKSGGTLVSFVKYLN